MQISVIGDSEEKKNVDVAYQVGRELAENKCILICGGRTGVMEAACRGAKDAGGTTVGISTSENGHELNKYVDIKIRTGLGYARNAAVAYSGDAIIVVGGSHGTLSEMCYASLSRKPIICIKGTGGWADKIGNSVDLKTENQIRFVSDAKEAVKLAVHLCTNCSTP